MHVATAVDEESIYGGTSNVLNCDVIIFSFFIETHPVFFSRYCKSKAIGCLHSLFSEKVEGLNC